MPSKKSSNTPFNINDPLKYKTMNPNRIYLAIVLAWLGGISIGITVGHYLAN